MTILFLCRICFIRIRWSHDFLVFILGISVLAIQQFYIGARSWYSVFIFIYFFLNFNSKCNDHTLTWVKLNTTVDTCVPCADSLFFGCWFRGALIIFHWDFQYDGNNIQLMFNPLPSNNYIIFTCAYLTSPNYFGEKLNNTLDFQNMYEITLSSGAL